MNDLVPHTSIWLEVAIAWQTEGRSRQEITDKLLLAIGPRLARVVLENLA